MKKTIALILTLVISVSSFSLISGCSKGSTEAFITRAQWVEALASQFGLDDYSTDEPFFTDIDRSSDIFNYIQSCCDWGIITPDKSDFRPDESVRTSFAVETALKAADIDVGESSYVEYAAKNGAIENDSFKVAEGTLTPEKADKILNWAVDLYHSKESEPVENVVLNPEVKDKRDVIAIETEPGQYNMEGKADVKENDIVILPPTPENPSGVARKITEVVYNDNGTVTVTTVEPEIGEVYEEVEISGVVAVPTKEDIILADGVTFADKTTNLSYTGGAKTGSLISSSGYDVESIAKGEDFSLNINFTNGKVSVAKNWDLLLGTSLEGKLTADTEPQIRDEKGNLPGEWFNKTSVIPDKNLFGKDPYDNSEAIEKYQNGEISLDELKSKLDLNPDQTEKHPSVMTGKFSGGYEINGKLQIKNVYVKPDIKLSKNWLGIPNGIDSYSIEVNYELESSLTFKGKLESELTIATMPIPIGATGFSVSLEAILFANANGELEVKLVVSDNLKTEYKNGQTKKSTTKESSLECNASIKLDVGPGIKVELKFLGIGVADAKIKCAFRFKAEAGIKYSTTYDETDEDIIIVRQSSFNLDVNGYFPIITLSLGSKDTLMGKIKLSFSWELVGEDKAVKMKIYSSDGDVVFWQDVTQLSKDIERVTEPAAGYIGISAYTLSLSPGKSEKLTIKTLPDRYSKDDLTWRSNRSEVADVSSDGLVTAKAEGHATITVSTSDGLYIGACVVNVSTEDSQNDTGGGGSR